MLELISIHINKTAGKSFGYLLHKNYDSGFFHINTDDYKKEHRSLTCKASELKNRIPTCARVLHGHFTAKQIIPLIETNRPPIVAWLRDPVERVLSNYFHDIKHGYTCLTLLDYIDTDVNINKMSRMLNGLSLDYFTFGLQEKFERDVVAMSKLFGWKVSTPLPYINSTKRERVSSYIRDMIRDLNNDDVYLYNTVKGNRK